MNKISKNQKGVTLIALAITIITILILTASIIYNLRGNLTIGKLSALHTDIRNLRDKVTNYYSRYTQIPADMNMEYTNIAKIREAGVISDVADTGKFYVLDLTRLENVTLNYGRDFEKIRNKEVTTLQEINNLTDLYIINADSHNIFYVGGILVNNEEHYTDYTKDEIDTKAVELKNIILRPQGGVDQTTTFSTKYGRVDVIWLEGQTNNPTGTPNEPILTKNGETMQKVTWEYNSVTGTWNEDTTPKTTWYEYVAGNGNDDNLESKWANAKTADGSYFVWIPRFAYRITYYESETSTEPTGYYDGYGMWSAGDGKLRQSLDSGIETVTYKSKRYIVHPAFETNLDNGGWSEDITGFWVAKYEMSRENSTDGTTWTPQGTTDCGGGDILTNDTVRAVSKPYTASSKVSSWRDISIGKMYTNSFSYDRAKESHLMKNSEWGAVAYLAHSQYGRNGYEITINNNSNYCPGMAGDTIYAEPTVDTANIYNTYKGALASTTGNVYGIYDMSGGAWEYVAAWDTEAEDLSDAITRYASSFASKGGASTEYATAYHNGTSSNSGNSTIYRVGKIGDATKEVNRGGADSLTTTSYYDNWFGDYPYVAYSIDPFFARGGNQKNGSSAGMFYTVNGFGSVSSNTSFRVVLIP